MFLRRLAAFFTDRRGNVGIIFGLTAVPAIGVVGAGIDFARANHERAALQSMLDSAVLAGVASSGKEATTAKAFFDAQAAGLTLTDANAAFTMGADSTLTGTATGTMETTLLGVMHITTIELGASAAAKVYGAPASSDPAADAGGKVCILLVDPYASQSFLANGGAKITAPDCEIHVRSTANPAAIINGSTDLNVQKICVKGSKVIINGSGKPPVETDCAALDDPYAGKLPSIAVPANCTVSNANYNANGADVDLPSGNYCNVSINGARNVTMRPGLFQSIIFNGSTSISMAPGLYVFKNSSVVNSGSVMKGTGVSIYFPDANSKIQFNGDVTLNLSAPATGDNAGLLFFEPTGLSKSSLVFNSTDKSVIEGMMYLPSRNVTFNSASNITAHKVMLVYNTMILNASGWTFSGSDKAVPLGSGAGEGETEVPRRVVLVH
jgi:hypothetical protein